MGLRLETMFEPEHQQDQCRKLWKLLHHNFGYHPNADIKVKGCILHLLSGEKSDDTFPVKPTLEGLLLAENAPDLAVRLYFHRRDAALLSPFTQSGLINASGEYEWKAINLLDADWITPSDLARFVWDGSRSLSEHFSHKVNQNLSTRSLVLPIFNQPLYFTIHFKYSSQLVTDEKRIEDLRCFKVTGHCPDQGTGFMDQTAEYRLFSIVNLNTDNVRLYRPDTKFIMERVVSPQPGIEEPPIMDNGVWKVYSDYL
ncbi:hypothetical protein VSDG_06933 [Cytospora chrysosperma]|uniref:Uncharacterized protein n=1 Tax=Cytospora chrysosperma TaxID=252740 RepID=A0A423VQN4_CYTCH|nr:hypothetical protein VSDG_06933 [Valsa sordida]